MVGKTIKHNCSEASIICGLKSGPGPEFNAAVNCLYEQCKPGIDNWIRQRGGDAEDRNDVFQEALIEFLMNLARGAEITTSVCGYFFGIARNIWYKMLRKRDREIELQKNLKWETMEKLATTETVEEKSMLQDEIVQNCWAKLSARCRDILTDYYFGERLSFEQIAGKYGYKTAHTARMTKLRCLQSLRDCAGPQLDATDLVF